MESVGPADDDDSGEMANRGRLGHHARMMGPHGMGSHEGMMGRNNNQRNGKVIAEDGDTVGPLKTVIQPEVGVRGTLDSFPLPIFLIPHSISTYPIYLSLTHSSSIYLSIYLFLSLSLTTLGYFPPFFLSLLFLYLHFNVSQSLSLYSTPHLTLTHFLSLIFLYPS